MKSKWLAIAVFAGAWALPAEAQMVRGQDPGSLVSALQNAGYAAKLGTDKLGDPMISSGVSGTAFEIMFYNCTANKECATVTFYSQPYKLASPPGLDRINEWNRSKRFGRAYLDKVNRPVLEMDVDLDDGGMSSALFIDNIEFWSSVLIDFERHVGYRK